MSGQSRAKASSDGNGKSGISTPEKKPSVTGPLSNVQKVHLNALKVWAEIAGELGATVEITEDVDLVTLSVRWPA